MKRHQFKHRVLRLLASWLDDLSQWASGQSVRLYEEARRPLRPRPLVLPSGAWLRLLEAQDVLMERQACLFLSRMDHDFMGVKVFLDPHLSPRTIRIRTPDAQAD